MPSTNCAYVNGRFVPEAEGKISIFDRGFLYGAGVFETLRVYSGHMFRWREHFDRLFAGLAHLKIESPLSPEELRTIFDVLIERNCVDHGFARAYVTSGVSQEGPMSRSEFGTSVVAIAAPREFETPRLQVIVSSMRLDKSLSVYKTANRLPYLLAREQAERAGANEAVLLNDAGRVVEFTTSNLFVVKAGELFTPALSEGPLPGITREVILLLASEALRSTHEARLGLDFLKNADEIFATNSLMEVVPVVRFGDRALTQSRVTTLLQDAYREFVRKELSL